MYFKNWFEISRCDSALRNKNRQWYLNIELLFCFYLEFALKDYYLAGNLHRLVDSSDIRLTYDRILLFFCLHESIIETSEFLKCNWIFCHMTRFPNEVCTKYVVMYIYFVWLKHEEKWTNPMTNVSSKFYHWKDKTRTWCECLRL